MELEGRLTQILPEQSGQGRTGNTWRKQSFIIETMDSQYPKRICVDVWGDNINTLNSFKINDELKVSIDIESREYNGKWFTNVKAWRIEKKADAAPQAGSSAPPPEEPPLPGVDDIPTGTEPTDDLPF
jgi:hypothetical protein